MNQLQALEDKLKYHFINKCLLNDALIHPSKGGKSFQRLEFLGDRILNLSLTLILMKDIKATEGELAAQLARLACSSALKSIALNWELNRFLECTNTQIASILPDACEAVLGAIFLDCNDLDTLKLLVSKHWDGLIQEKHVQDSKTFLQELAYKRLKALPVYLSQRISGQDHNPVFKSTLKVLDIHVSATGASKKEAEKNAADQMLLEFEKLL